jgi:hypothetical protein
MSVGKILHLIVSGLGVITLLIDKHLGVARVKDDAT